MEEKTPNVNSRVPQAQSQAQVQRAVEDNARVLEQKFKETPATEQAVSVTMDTPAQEHREAYGTAKTENLRDSGLWRILLPGFVVLCCLALLAIPLIILTPLFVNSLDSNAAANQLHEPITWIWIVMIIIVLSIVAVVIRGLLKIFITSTGNYSR